MLKPHHIAFFANYRWFLRDNGDGSISVKDKSYFLPLGADAGHWVESVLTFDRFSDVCAWAGIGSDNE